MRVLGLASYPVEAAATRYRLEQFVEPLANRGIELRIKPFLDSALFASLYRRDRILRTVPGLMKAAGNRMRDIVASRGFDVLLVQREAMLFGPPVVERLSMALGKCPMVLDLDDATYVSYTSPTYGKLASRLKWFGKTDKLIERSTLVTCGNSSIAQYVTAKGKLASIIPTVVDLDKFRPVKQRSESDRPVLGWVGTHSTFPYLESIFPVLQELAKKRDFRLKIVGSGVEEISIPGVEIENLQWRLEREIADFQSFDVGLYPMRNDEWTSGKSGFKAIQYMAVGIPFVVTPVAVCAEIGVSGKTHLAATTPAEWFSGLDKLLESESVRRAMGLEGRIHAEEHFNLPLQSDRLASALNTALRLKGEM